MYPKPVKRVRARKPLQRSPMRRKRARRIERGLGDPAYLDFVRTLPCAVGRSCWRAYVCQGTIHAHHAGRRPGIAMKAPDNTAIPLCADHHRAWHDASGVFARLTKMERFAWSQRAIAETQAACERLLGRLP